MICIKNIFKKFALVTSAFFLCFSVFSQAFGELLPGSSALIYDESKGIHKLVDGANFTYQGNTMYSDSAYYYESDKTIRAYGNVSIRKSDNVSIFCDSLLYQSSNRLAHLWGHVRATDSEYRLTTDSMIYNTKNEQGIYRNGGKIENQLKNEVLTSKVGYFQPSSKNFFFRGNVVYTSDELRMTTDSLQYRYQKNTCYFYGPTCIATKDAFIEGEKGWYNVETDEGSIAKNAMIEQKSRTIKGDSLYYSPQNKMAEGFNNVYVVDTTDKISFTSDYALLNDSLKYSLLTKNAILTKYQNADTIHIHADTLYNLNDSLNERMLTLGYHGVKIFSSNIQGVGDSLSYARNDSYMELYRKPILWSKNGEIKGDSMRVYMNDSIVEKAYIWGKSTAVMELDSGNYYNQVGGKEMTAYFVKNEIKTVKVIGNAQTIYFPEEESGLQEVELDSTAQVVDSVQMTAETDSLIAPKDTMNLTIDNSESTDSIPAPKTIFIVKRIGMNRFYAAEIKVYFDSGEVVGVTYFERPDGVFYPMDQINKEEQFIQNFSTNFALRPKSIEDLLKD